jgi:toxin CcdB
MAQLCVYKNPNPRTRAQYPYLLDIQNDLLSELRTTIVIPLMPSSVASPITLSNSTLVSFSAESVLPQ